MEHVPKEMNANTEITTMSNQNLKQQQKEKKENNGRKNSR